jgi:predicted PurR-regulated permease PerM
MLSLFAFGYLFGFLGLLIAIPLAASLGVILRFVISQLLGGSDQGIAPARAGAARRARPG